jgi:DNA polymerase-1
MINQVVFDLETAPSDELFRRADFMRLNGYLINGRPHTTTDHAHMAKLVAGADLAIGHNISAFDLIVLARHAGLSLPDLRGRTYDTDLRLRLIDPPPSGKDGNTTRPRGYYGLDQSCLRYDLPHKTDNLKALARRHGGFDRIPVDDPEYVGYLEGDLIATAALADHLGPLDDYARREMNIGLITAQMTVNGFRVDVPELSRALVEQAKRKAANIAELSAITGMPVQGINPLASDAGKAAIEKFFLDQGLKARALPRTAKTGKLSTGREDVTAFRDMLISKANGRDISKILRVLDLIVSIVGERTVYKTAETCRIGDRVHPNIRPLQASGRWSVTSPGLTVYGKRKGRHTERRIFLPEEGHVLIAFDADQVDARAVAAHSGDEGYLRIFREGLDLHAENAAVAFGDRGRREDAKPIGHGWNYGMSARKMAMQGVDYDLAVQFDRRMREAYPDLVEWQNRVRSIAADDDLLDNGFGRKMRANPMFAYTQAPALVGQGCTRDIMAEGMLRLPVEYWPFLRTIVHDEIVMSVPEKDADEIARDVQARMSFDLAEATGGRLASVPITVGRSKYGKNWADVYEK